VGPRTSRSNADARPAVSERLQLRGQGLVTDEEYAAARRKILDDRRAPCAFLPVQALLRLSFFAVGIHHRGQVPPGTMQVGGVQASGFLQQNLFTAAA